MRIPRSWFALVAIFILTACQEHQQIAWTVRASDPSILEQSVIIETTIRRGGCEGVLIYRQAITRDQPGPTPDLGRGLHGFGAEARDASCLPIARACIERDLPLAAGTQLELVLERVNAPPACGASNCTAGVCSSDDGGESPVDAHVVVPGDAGVDTDAWTSPIDAAIPPEDSGMTIEDDAAISTFDAGPPPSTCDDGTMWTEHCYRFTSEPRDWSSAQAACLAWHGHLVSLGGPDEETFVHSIATGEFYIGLHDLNVEGVFEWIDGSSSSYRHFSSDSHNRDNNDCASDSAASGWLMQRCMTTRAYVCER